MICSDFHIHTRYCHGEGEPIDFVQQALRRNAKAIGLLGHARMRIPCSYAMTPAAEKTLFDKVTALKAAYNGRLDVFCGIELDYFSQPADLPYDYRIGSVHYVRCGDVIYSVDSEPEYLADAIRDLYDGDSDAMAADYYRQVAQILDVTQADIVGHFDLVTKFNPQHKVFDDTTPGYRKAALAALETLVRRDPLFEINSGAISRGYCTDPYPARWLLEALHEMGGRIILSSDAHHPSTMFYQFDRSAELAKSCGFATAWVLTAEGFRDISL